MIRRTQVLGLLLGACLSLLNAEAQITFYATNVPSRVGTDYCRAYLNTTGADVSTLVGQPGGPRRWDFSQPQAAGEFIRRTDIVAPSDSGHGAGFASATYAERDTKESTGEQSWSYYRVSTNVGRIYYGFYDANSNPTCPRKLFNAPTTELPDGIHYGQTWTRTVDFPDCVAVGGSIYDLDVHFTCQSQVDAYGTVVLPRLGELPALRVNEVNTYAVSLFGTPLTTQVFRNYYWLVRGIGKAVLIGSDASSSVPPANFATAKTYLRVFESSAPREGVTPRPVTDLRLRLQNGQSILTWSQAANATGYRIETLTNLSLTNWQLLAEPAVNTWSNALPVTEAQRFFRVYFKP